MKNKIIFILILLPNLIFSQHRNRLEFNDLHRYHLKGNVETLKYYKYNVTYKNDSISQVKFEDFIVPKNYMIEFNQDGYIRKKIEYRLKNDSIIEKGLWLYNYENDKIKKEIYYWNNRSKDTTQWHYLYPDESTTIINQESTMSPKLMHYIYKQVKNKEYYKSINADSSFIGKSLYVYDKRDRIIRIEKYDDQEYTRDIILKSYSDSINLNPKVTVSSYTKYDAPVSINQYKFNDQYDIIEIDGLDVSDDIKTIIEYKYDDNKNWIVKIKKGGTGKIYKIYKREISYY